ncbi:hypothetical protein PR003_g25793 [Phytophthora rubi]|uniref:BZIP domain-containing protein n=1 Tax=Phytophthora rubi TaxID=129364 RepID=A0A6A3IDF9_9STRA|nr:hypothetical protein PR002_g24460 [Phytophthora rubi]KAE8979492.1 hypothetical protein PR001_g24539 [Phytophthora rubi]KAE9288499.1 hypothetical protein PR003_g25793 [Phytophthora rubi]
MTKSCLQPPTSAFLTDNVIGSVFLRSESSDSRFIVEGDTSFPSRPVHLPFVLPTTSSVATVQPTEDCSLNGYGQELDDSRGDLDELKGISLTKTGGKRRSFSLPRAGRDGDEVIVKRCKRTLVGGDVVPTIEGMMAEEKYQRELRRLRQLRYRKKKFQLAQGLDKEVQELRRKIQRLEQRHQAICAGSPVRETAWNVVAQYFHLFRNGYSSMTESSRTAATGTSVRLGFLQAKMAPNVFHPYGCGPDSLLENWERISLWLSDIKYRPVALEQEIDGSLLASTTTSFTITEATLLNVFPHLCTSGNSGSERDGRSHLAAKLLGKGS